jgi:hypothetical protein
VAAGKQRPLSLRMKVDNVQFGPSQLNSLFFSFPQTNYMIVRARLDTDFMSARIFPP